MRERAKVWWKQYYASFVWNLISFSAVKEFKKSIHIEASYNL